MSSFKEGCVVRYRPAQSLYTVVRWDQDAEVLLLTPAVDPSTAIQSTTTKERPRTRWAFEKMVDVVEKSKAPADSSVATKSAAAAAAGAGTAAPTKHSAKASTLDPTQYARRAAKLDRRVEFRRRPKRGRGLFARCDIPKGTEVMRVPAAGAVLSGHAAKDSCAECFLSTMAVGPLDACHGCPLRFCARCKKYGVGGHNGGTCELTKQLLGMCATNPGGGSGSPNEGLLRLVADLFLRRKAGVLSDEEWDLVMSLESHENEARELSLAPNELQKCARLLESLVGIDVSHENLQAMYRRVTRNMHVVTPNTTARGVCSGSPVEGLFPCGALLNHSCLPNSCFHCVAKASSSVDGPPVIEQVLRTSRDVRAGEELCYSYISDLAAASVLERRTLLEGWGFRCACERCQGEAEECIRIEAHPTPIDAVALNMLRRLEQIVRCGQRDARALKEEEIAQTLEQTAQFLVAEREKRLSPLLASTMAIHLMEVTTVVGVSNPLLRFSVCGFAAEAFSRIGSPSEIFARAQQYTFSAQVPGCEGLHASQEQLEHVKIAGLDARLQAVRLHELMYGKDHEQSIDLRTRLGVPVPLSR